MEHKSFITFCKFPVTDGSNYDARLDYTVYYDEDDSDSLFNGLLGVIEDAEIMALRDDISIIEMHDRKERVSFYNLEIV